MQNINIIYQNNTKDNINNLTTKVEGYKVFINWDWPSFNSNVNHVCVFEVIDEKETLEQLIARNAQYTLVPRLNDSTNPYKFEKILKENQKQFVFYPAIIENGVTTIFEQLESNKTDVFYKKIVLIRDINYMYSLNKLKIAKIHIKNKDKLKELSKDALFYYKYNINTRVPTIYYPVNMDLLYKDKLTVLVEKGYNIELIPNKKYSSSIIIKS